MRIVVGMPLGEARGGAERLLRTLVRHSAHELHVVLTRTGPLADQLRADGAASVSEVAFGRLRSPRATAAGTRAAARVLRDVAPDLVLGWLPEAHVRLAPAAALAGRPPLAWWQHHTGEGERALVRIATALPARGIVCTSGPVAEHQRAVRPRRRLIVCEPGIEPPPASVSHTNPSSGERGTRTAPVVGMSGRLVPWKGQDRFVDAIRALREQGRDVRGVVIGDEAHGLSAGFGAAVRERARGLPVEFTGHVDHPLDLVAGLDVLVNASEEEPFGMTLVEAMALGVPTVAVDRGGPRGILDGGRAGVLVPDHSPAALAAGIARLLDDPAHAAALAAAGRERYEARYTATAFAARADAALTTLATPPNVRQGGL